MADVPPSPTQAMLDALGFTPRESFVILRDWTLSTSDQRKSLGLDMDASTLDDVVRSWNARKT